MSLEGLYPPKDGGEWSRHSGTRKVRRQLESAKDELLRALLSACHNSTDARVAAVAARYKCAVDVLELFKENNEDATDE